MEGEEDDNSSEKVNKVLRHGYRSLIEDYDKRREESADAEPDFSASFSDELTRADDLFSKVSRPREARLDSEFIFKYTAAFKQDAQALHTNLLTFNSGEFSEKLLSFLGRNLEGEEESIPNDMWIKLGEFASNMFRITPSYHYMYGSFEPGAVEIKKRTQKIKDKEGPVKATVPKSVDIDKCVDEQESTTEEVERVLSIIHKLYEAQDFLPLDYFEFVVNPNSFSHTVENMFHVSFLVKDEAVRIFFDDEQLPVIKPVIKPETNERTDSNGENRNQAILSISVDEWREIVKVFQIEHPAIPPRASRKRC